MPLADNVVNQVARGSRQHQSARTADEHQQESHTKHTTARADQFANIRPKFAEALRRALFRDLRRHGGLNYCMGCAPDAVGFGADGAIHNAEPLRRYLRIRLYKLEARFL